MAKISVGNVPAYIEVYNSLYSDITNNVYLEGEQLPGENALSEKYGVSRNTLRQALAILCEDGLVIKSQGKGTVIANRGDSKLNEQIINPMLNMCKAPIDDIELHYNFALRPHRTHKAWTQQERDRACQHEYLPIQSHSGRLFFYTGSGFCI